MIDVAILNSTKPLYSHNYDDSDGILDLELVPTHKLSMSSAKTSSNNVTSTESNNATTNATITGQFTTWGPDFIGQSPFHTTGTFHIRGPVLVENSPYSKQVSIVGKDDKVVSTPISETFLLPPILSK